MKNRIHILNICLSDAELEQLRCYVNQTEIDGWYYDPEKNFSKHHETIKIALGMISDDSNKEH